MNKELLNIVARGILQLTGLSPEQIQTQVNRRTLESQPKRTAPSVPKAQLPPEGQPTPAAGPDIPERGNPFAADPGRGRSPQGVKGINQNLNQLMSRNRSRTLSGKVGNKRTAAAELLINTVAEPIGKALAEPFQDLLAQILGYNMEEYELIKQGNKSGKTKEQISSELKTFRQSPERKGYTGMADASGDPKPPTPEEQLKPYIAPDAPFAAPRATPNPSKAPVGSAPQQRSILPPNRPNPWYP